ncbi:MAG: histidinol phosphatase [Chitinophagaceae bacterium]|nr:histidinol phosphatase [Chitinophagaceae bacterium]
MFSFFKKRSSSSGPGPAVLPIHTDIHSHILPGIDDGSPDVETSIQLVKGLYDLGIRKTVATPHIIADMFRNTPATINAALDKLKEAIAAEGIGIEISAAAEYMLDDYFLKLLRTEHQLLTIKDNIVLTEQSYATPTGNLNDIAFELVTAGYKPIMAHPERYAFYHGKYDEFLRLKDMGFMLQVNLLSLTGYYGKGVAKAAKYIFKNELADFVGTDLHHDRHLSMLQHPTSLKLFNDYLGYRKFNDLSLL